MRNRSSSRFRVCAMAVFLFAAAFLVPASMTGDARLYLLAAAVPGLMLLLLLLPAGFFSLDRPVLAAALTLCALGILAPVFVQPDEAISQSMRCVAALLFLMAGAVLIRVFRPSVLSAALLSLAALGMIALPFLFPEAGLSMAQGGTALLIAAAAAYLSLRLRLPALAVSLAGTMLYLLLRDLPSAFVWGVLSVLVFWASSGSALWSVISAAATGGLLAGWLLLVPGETDAVRESLLSEIASMPLFLPEVAGAEGNASADTLFLLLGNQFGLLFLLGAVLLLGLLLIRGTSLALHARKAFHASAAFGAMLFFALRALFFLLALTDLIPFIPGDFPLLTSSLPQLFAEFFLLGTLCGVSARNESDLEEDVRLSMLAH